MNLFLGRTAGGTTLTADQTRLECACGREFKTSKPESAMSFGWNMPELAFPKPRVSLRRRRNGGGFFPRCALSLSKTSPRVNRGRILPTGAQKPPHVIF